MHNAVWCVRAMAPLSQYRSTLFLCSKTVIPGHVSRRCSTIDPFIAAYNGIRSASITIAPVLPHSSVVPSFVALKDCLEIQV